MKMGSGTLVLHSLAVTHGQRIDGVVVDVDERFGGRSTREASRRRSRPATGGIRKWSLLCFVLDFEAAKRANIGDPLIHFLFSLRHQVVSSVFGFDIENKGEIYFS